MNEEMKTELYEYLSQNLSVETCVEYGYGDESDTYTIKLLLEGECISEDNIYV